MNIFKSIRNLCLTSLGLTLAAAALHICQGNRDRPGYRPAIAIEPRPSDYTSYTNGRKLRYRVGNTEGEFGPEEDIFAKGFYPEDPSTWTFERFGTIDPQLALGPDGSPHVTFSNGPGARLARSTRTGSAAVEASHALPQGRRQLQPRPPRASL